MSMNDAYSNQGTDMLNMLGDLEAERMENKIEKPMQSARILIEVVAGLIPGTPLPEHTKQFAISSDAWYCQGTYEGKKKEAQDVVMQVYGHAQEYMRTLMNPSAVNWVRLDWIYF